MPGPSTPHISSTGRSSSDRQALLDCPSCRSAFERMQPVIHVVRASMVHALNQESLQNRLRRIPRFRSSLMSRRGMSERSQQFLHTLREGNRIVIRVRPVRRHNEETVNGTVADNANTADSARVPNLSEAAASQADVNSDNKKKNDEKKADPEVVDEVMEINEKEGNPEVPKTEDIDMNVQ